MLLQVLAFLSPYEISHTSSLWKNSTCAIPSLAYAFAGSGVVYVDLLRHMVSTSRGILKYSTVRASANE